jgi:hypothetical protein
MNLHVYNASYVCSLVELSVNEPTIDLSEVTFFAPAGLVYLGMFLRYHNAQGKALRVVLPRSAEARQYLARQNFWSRFNFDPKSLDARDLRRFSSTTSLDDILDIERSPFIAEEIGQEVRNILQRESVKVDQARIGEMLSELVDNFAQHSGDLLGVFAMQFYPRKKWIHVAIGDCGVGIRASLSKNPRYAELADQLHRNAALRAFEPGVSSKREGGTGLTEVEDGIRDLKGILTLTTGDASVRINGPNSVYSTPQMRFEMPGVQISLEIPVE